MNSYILLKVLNLICMLKIWKNKYVRDYAIIRMVFIGKPSL